MRNPKDFFRPLAVGAPEPLREIPVKPSRMIHFFDPSNPKMLAKVPELALQADILLGNLEDAIPADRKVAAREGLVTIGREVDGLVEIRGTIGAADEVAVDGVDKLSDGADVKVAP
jgi:malyl-CoA/(S)-citramalyl-CoA lyase